MNFRLLLFPFALLYNLITRVRNFLFDTGIFSITGFECPIISVGNLNTGGTGKTPHIEYLIRLLLHDHKIATLSRGYGRKSNRFQIVRSNLPVAKCGDEPLQFKTKFPDIKVIVGANRVKSMMSLLASYPDINTVLLDDAFQHRSIKPGLSILLTDYKFPYYKDYLLPVGNLREPASSIKRAQIIIVTKTPDDATEDSIKRIRTKIKLLPLQSLFFSTIKFGNLKPVNDGYPILSLADLKTRKVIAFSGIAKPGSFIMALKNKSASFKHLRFKDHHPYTEKELENIVKKFSQLGGNDNLVVCTEKDWMRIINEPYRKVFNHIPVYTLETFVDFIDPKEKEIFDTKIKNYVEKNQPNRIFNRKQDGI